MKKSYDEKREDIYFEAMLKGEITEAEYKSVLEGKAYVNGARVSVKGRNMNALEYGTICDARPKSDSYGVDFKKDIGGHDCDGKCENGHGWYYGKDALELV